MLSNQSVSGQPSPAPTAHGVLPSLFSFCVSASRPFQVVGGVAFSRAGSYQTVLFEFPFATIPHVSSSNVVRSVQALL